MYKNKKRHSSNQGLTKTQLQRFMSLVALNNNVSPLLQKYVVTDLINGKFIEFVDDKFVITNVGIKEIDRLFHLANAGSIEFTEKKNVGISPSISS